MSLRFCSFEIEVGFPATFSRGQALQTIASVLEVEGFSVDWQPGEERETVSWTAADAGDQKYDLQRDAELTDGGQDA